MSLLAFAVAVASLLVVPGPSNTLLATSGAMVGVRRSLIMIGCEIAGYTLSIGALSTIGRALIALVPDAKLGVRVALILFILFIAQRLWRSVRHGEGRDAVALTPGTVFFTTLLNPKALIFAFGIFPPLLGLGTVVQYGGTFVAIAMVIGLGWISLGAFAGSLFGQRKIFIARVSAVALVAFACVAATVL